MSEKKIINIHFENIDGDGLGASNISYSLLEYLNPLISNKSKLYSPKNSNYFLKFFPKSIKRFFTYFFEFKIYNLNKNLLVLGDIPLNYSGYQILFLQNDLLFNKNLNIKIFFKKIFFKKNIKYVNQVVVQSPYMKKQFLSNFKNYNLKVNVIPSLPSIFFLRNYKNYIYKNNSNKKFNLFYPSKYYQHKNHKILRNDIFQNSKLYDQIFLTIDKKYKKKFNKKIMCTGLLNHKEILDYYKNTQCLIILSKIESFCLPLVEGMYLQKIIICPDLPYSRFLCGEKAIYFDLNDPKSLLNAIAKARILYLSQIKIDWNIQISHLPINWKVIAEKFYNLF